MRNDRVFLSVLLLLGGAALSGCVSSDDRFVGAVTGLGDAAKLHPDLLNQSAGNHDFHASREQRRPLVAIYDTHIRHL
jgi:hypothetical protein